MVSMGAIEARVGEAVPGQGVWIPRPDCKGIRQQTGPVRRVGREVWGRRCQRFSAAGRPSARGMCCRRKYINMTACDQDGGRMVCEFPGK